MFSNQPYNELLWLPYNLPQMLTYLKLFTIFAEHLPVTVIAVVSMAEVLNIMNIWNKVFKNQKFEGVWSA